MVDMLKATQQSGTNMVQKPIGDLYLCVFITHWHHLATTIEPSVCGSGAALCELTLTICLQMNLRLLSPLRMSVAPLSVYLFLIALLFLDIYCIWTSVYLYTIYAALCISSVFISDALHSMISIFCAICVQGFLYKKSGKPLSKEWKKKYATLMDDGHLIYYPNYNVGIMLVYFVDLTDI